MTTETILVAMQYLPCANCGLTFGVPSTYDAKSRESGRSFYCPNGHSLSYHETALMRSEKAAKRAQELLDQERRRTAELRVEVAHKESQRVGELAAKTRLKNRIAHGVCPCCNRTFQNLARHMQTKHPKEMVK